MITAISTNLYRLRQEKNLSQREAAKKLGISQALLSHYENGVREPGLGFLHRACDFYHVSADYMLGRSSIREEAQLQIKPVAKPQHPGGEKRTSHMTTIGRFYYNILVNAMRIVFDIIGEMKEDEAANAAYEYMGTAIYRLYRNLAQYAPDGTNTLYEVDDLDVTVGTTRADMIISELEYHRVLKNRKDNKQPFPSISYQNLEEKYPNEFRSLLEIIYSGGRRNQHMQDAHKEESKRLLKENEERVMRQAAQRGNR